MTGGGFKDTVARIEKATAAAGMIVFAEVDHPAGARDAGMTMRASVLVPEREDGAVGR